MKTILCWIFVLILFIVVSWFAYRFSRWMNYELYYKDKVEQSIKPFNKRIDDLEKRVKLLESNGKVQLQ